tara:strand:+ start:6093 stop:8231 length:2139 start_codon:yes stop_codon:yes gene_type:complete
MAFMESSFDTDVENAENLGIRQLTQLQQEYPRFAVGVAMENLKQDLVAQERQRQMDNQPAPQSPDVITQTEQEVMGMLAGGGQQPPMPQQGMGISQLPADNMAMPMAAEGGIVGFAGKGPSMVKETPQMGSVSPKAVDSAQIKQFADLYENLEKSIATATDPREKSIRAGALRDLVKQMGDQFIYVKQYLDSKKGVVQPRTQMAGGGIVALQEGGLLKVGDIVEGGETIVTIIPASRTGTGEDIPVTQAEYDTYLESNTLPPNRNANRTASSEEGIPAALERSTPEDILGKRLQQVDEATGNVFTGEGGLMQELQAIAADPAYDSWWKQLGASGVAATEAVGQGLLKSLGILGADAEYLGRGIGDTLVGGGEKLDERTAEQVEAARQQITAQTQQAIDALEEERNAISNNPDMFNTEEGKARLAEIGEEIANQTAGLQARLEGLTNVPAPTEALTETITSLPQQGFNLLDSMFEQYEKNVAAGEAAREAERKEALRRDIDAASNEAIQSQRGTLSDDDYKLGQMAQAMFKGQPGSQQPPSEVEGSSTETKRSGLDKILDIASLLGGAAGSSKGYEGQSILNQQRQDRILEDQQAFELAKQQALLDQRTEERQLIEEQRLAIARAGEMAQIDIGQIMLDPAVRQKREELIEKHDEWFGYDEEAVERELNAFILQLLKQRRQEVGALYDTMQSGGGTSSALPPVPPDVTVTRSP